MRLKMQYIDLVLFNDFVSLRQLFLPLGQGAQSFTTKSLLQCISCFINLINCPIGQFIILNLP